MPARPRRNTKARDTVATEWLNIADAVAYTRLSRGYLYEKFNEIGVANIGRRTLISKQALDAWLNRHLSRAPRRVAS